MLQIASFLLMNPQAVHMKVEKGVVKTTENESAPNETAPGC